MEDHRTVLGWFQWYQQTDDPELKTEIVRKICMALRAHMAGEEEILYPGARMQTRADLVERALSEHEGAKRLVEQLEHGDSTDAEQAHLMVELEAEIRAHVDEEEGQLFPAVRGSEMDLYAVGRALAARRVDYLFQAAATTPADRELREYPNMQISQEEARDFFILGLKNCHATVAQGRTMIEAQLRRLESYPKVKQKLQTHLDEKDAQLERIESLLETHGESRSALKDGVMKMMANATASMSASAEDEIIKNSFATLAQAKYEAAAFETLILFGEAAGENTALKPLQKSLSESRGLAAFVEENLRATGMRFLQLRSQGVQACH